MNILGRQYCSRAELLEELGGLLQPLVFRASEGVSCQGSSFTLHAYLAAPFGGRPALDLVVERALADVEAEAFPPPDPECLAIELMRSAGESPIRPRQLVRARKALGRILEDPDLDDTDKADAAAALTRLNRPRISRQVMASLKFLVGVSTGETRQVQMVSLDASGFGMASEVPPLADCWLRVRHGPVLALEIAERLRNHVLTAGQPLQVRSALDDWTLAVEPASASSGSLDHRVRLRADPDLAFPSEGFAFVAFPEPAGSDWYIACVGADGEAVLAGLPPGKYHLGLALAPEAVAASGKGPVLDARTRVQAGGRAQERLTLETSDPALGNSRCVWVRERRPGTSVVVGESAVHSAQTADLWGGRAEFTIPRTALRARGGGGVVQTRGVVRTRGAAPVPESGLPGTLTCLVLL